MELREVQTADLSKMNSSDLGDQLVIFAGQGVPDDMSKEEYNEIIRKVFEAYTSAKEKETSSQATKEEKQITDDEFTRNATEMNKNSERFKLAQDQKECLDRFSAVDEEGKEINLTEEITEAAKTRVSVEHVDAQKPMSQEEYDRAVSNEIDLILGSIFIARGQQTAGEKNLEAAQRNAHDAEEFFNGAKKSVDARIVSGTLAGHIQETKDIAENKSSKRKNKSFFNAIGEKLNKLSAKLSDKLGKTYKQANAVIKSMKTQGTWGEFVAGGALAGASLAAALAGAGAVVTVPLAAGLAVYSGVTTYRRLNTLKNNYKKEKEANDQKYSFGDYFKNHKKEVITTGLYTIVGAAGVLGGAASAYLQASNALTAAQTATQVSTATQTAQTIQAASQTARITLGGGLLASSVLAPDVHDLINADDAKGRWHAVKQIGKKALVAGLVGYVAYETMDGISSANAGHVAPDGSELTDSTAVADSTATNGVAGTDVNTGADATVVPEVNYAVEPAGEKEMAVYLRNLKLVPDHEIMLDNIDAGLVKIPEGMSPAEAVNIARIQALNHGDETLLRALSCGHEYDLRETLHNIHENSWTKIDGVHKLGEMKGFVGDDCRYGIIKGVDCEDVKISVKNLCEENVVVNETVIDDSKPHIKVGGSEPSPLPTQPTPDKPMKPIEPVKIPTTPVVETPVVETPVVETPQPSNVQFEHVTSDANNISNQTKPDDVFYVKSTPVSEADINSNPINQVGEIKSVGGKLVGPDGKPLNLNLGKGGR